MNRNLETFKMNKSQMNKIGGGKNFRCTFNDSGSPGWGGQLPGVIILHGFPENATPDIAENHLQGQLGPEFFIYCEEA